MQTKRDIERLLSAAGVSPKHRLGQHFLIDLNLMRFLLDAADIRPDDVVLEVGSGTGSLTEGLADRAGAVVAVECDAELIPILRRRLADRPNVTLIHADALAGKHALAPAVIDAVTGARSAIGAVTDTSARSATDTATGTRPTTDTVNRPCAHQPGRLLLVANLPYNIAAPLMANLATGPLTADTMTVTVQLEVGLRMAAGPAHDHYGTLGILLGATGRVEILRRLPPSVFWPRPQVDSVIARYVRDPARVARIASMQTFRDVVHLLMTHRRKTLRRIARQIRRAATRSPIRPAHRPGTPSAHGPTPAPAHCADTACACADWPAVFERCGIDPARRPETLAPDDYIALANACRTSFN